ncbi:MAG: thermosome subunit alpha [Halobacteria archaeon]
MSQNIGNQPVLVLDEDTERTSGKDAQSMNISAAEAVAESVRTTLGPKGMDKMLAGDDGGNVIITNDGVTILNQMDIEHPAADMIVEVAESQEEEIGDGTTSSVVITGELLKKSRDLIDQDVHPTVITEGYRKASAKAQEVLEENASNVEPDDRELLEKIASTAMTGKGPDEITNNITDLIVGAVTAVNDNGKVDLDNIKIESVVGGSTSDSELIDGLIFDGVSTHENMPSTVEDADVALLDTPIEIQETETDAEINVESAQDFQNVLDQEEEQLREIVDEIDEAGADVIFSEEDIDDMAVHFLAKKGIMTVEGIDEDDVHKLARATDGEVISNINGIDSDDFGYAGEITEKLIGGDVKIYVRDCENPKSVSLVLRGGTEHVVDELERSIEDGLNVVALAIKNGKILPGGGATEVQVAKEVRDYADSVSGRQQLAVEAFADALEVIPRTLAENAGLDSIDSLVELRSEHDAGEEAAGLDVYSDQVKDMYDEGVIEPLGVKTQAFSSANEASKMILRIDDVISADVGGGGGGADVPGM